MRNLRLVTTSWDDGDPSDTRIANLLHSRGLPGTFYIPIHSYGGRKTLSGRDLRDLRSGGFEIGAHGVSHRSLSKLSHKELTCEVRDCKQTLEQLLGEQVLMFCYPNGRYNASVIRQVQQAGYEGARTTRMLCLRTEFRAFEMPTSLQAFPHRGLTYIKNQGRARSVSGLVKYLTKQKRGESWVGLGKRLFNQVLQHGGIWHLYGHSWEIDELGIWDDLREMLDYVHQRKEVTYITNGQLLSRGHHSPACACEKALY